MEAIGSLVARVAATEAGPEDRLAAFGEIVRRFQDMAYGCAYAVLGDFHLAEDAAQEAFLVVYRELPNLREPNAFAGWLRRIVLSQCHRMTRRGGISTKALDAAAELASAETPPLRALERREMREEILAAIRRLPDAQRMATTLFYIDGYSQNEIAEFLEVPVTTVKKRLATARERLRARMMSMIDETLKSHPLPDDFAEVIVREVASEADLHHARKHLAPGYHGKRQPELFETLDAARQAGIYVVEDRGEVASAGYFDETTFAIGSTPLRAVRPREMAGEAAVPNVDPAFVDFVKGYLGCFKLARERSIHLSVVHGSMYDHAFCGFVPCFYYPVATLPCETARSVDSRAMLVEADEAQAVEARQAWLLDPYAPKLTAWIGGGVPHVIEQDGVVVGYVAVNREFDPGARCDMPFGYVTDVTVRTRDAALAVVELCGELMAEDGHDEICFVQSHMTLLVQTMLGLGGTYRLRGSCDLVGLDAEMVAVLDWAGLTRELRGEFEARWHASGSKGTEAALSIEMDGATVGFVADGEHLEIVTEPRSVHRRLPRWLATRLYVGYHSGEDALAMGPIPWDRSDGKTADDPALDGKPLELPEPEAGLLAALFPKMWPVSWPDPDVWPWVIGRDHPRYQGEQRKTPEMKAAIDALRFPWLGY